MRPPISNRRTQLAWRAPYNIHMGKISTKEKCDFGRGGAATIHAARTAAPIELKFFLGVLVGLMQLSY